MKIYNAYYMSVFAVAVWGFVALLLTGEFSEALLAVCLALTGLAYWLLRRGVRTPDLFWNGLTLIAFGVTIYLARKSLLDAAIYFFMYLQIAKLFALHRSSDARWVYVVGFFQMVASAVLTTSYTFALIFTIYVCLMAASLMLWTLIREQEHLRSLAAAPAPGAVLPLPIAPRSGTQDEYATLRGVAKVAVLATFALTVCSVVFFMLVPRLSTQRLFQSYGKAPEKPPESAFDEKIEFGTFGKINLDNAVAMYVRPADLDFQEPPSYIRLRGVAVDSFDGRAWRRTTGAQDVQGPSPSVFAPFTRRIYAERAYIIIQPPGVTNYLFSDTFPETLRLPPNIPYKIDHQSNSAWLGSFLPKDLQYMTTARVEHLEHRQPPDDIKERTRQNQGDRSEYVGGLPLARAHRAAAAPQYLEKCLNLPPALDSQRIRTLAQEWTAQGKTEYEKARLIEDRFRRDFHYTLEQKAQGNFIEDFLFRVREGHCEYFATSMALMLRAIGVPSRVVNGYYATEWNDIANAFTVRQRDAHSWVEVYLGHDYGWMTFDPTPPSGVGRPSTQSALMAGLSRWGDAIKVRWYRYVIDYNFSDQIGVVRGALRAHSTISRLLGQLDPGLGAGGQLFAGTLGFGILAGGLLILPLLGAVAAYILWRLWRMRQPRRRRRVSEPGIRYYRDILRQLARLGYIRSPAQTPQEFATVLASTEPELSPLLDITHSYYFNRFNGVPPTALETRAAATFLKHLKSRNRR